MLKRRFPAVVEKVEDGYIGYLENMPIYAQGKTPEEVEEELREGLRFHLQCVKEKTTSNKERKKIAICL